MWSRLSSLQTGSRIALLIGQLVVIALCVAYIDYVYLTHILPDKQAKDTFREAECYLVSKKLSTKGFLLNAYRADFLISYTVDGTQYNRWVSGNGLDFSYTRNKTGEQAILDSYDEGANYTCYYDPDSPDIAVLILRHNWLSTFPLMIPSVIILILLYYMCINIYMLFIIKKSKQ